MHAFIPTHESTSMLLHQHWLKATEVYDLQRVGKSVIRINIVDGQNPERNVDGHNSEQNMVSSSATIYTLHAPSSKLARF